jgi:hypothetical protein
MERGLKAVARSLRYTDNPENIWLPRAYIRMLGQIKWQAYADNALLY